MFHMTILFKTSVTTTWIFIILSFRIYPQLRENNLAIWPKCGEKLRDIIKLCKTFREPRNPKTSKPLNGLQGKPKLEMKFKTWTVILWATKFQLRLVATNKKITLKDLKNLSWIPMFDNISMFCNKRFSLQQILTDYSNPE